jgi:response regulator RpfG family c-di-GMP phosphodiesterase
MMAKALPPVKVLVVDDDPAILEFMETFLTKDGFEVNTIAEPKAAADEVKDGGYHLVVLDLMMPGLGGVEALEPFNPDEFREVLDRVMRKKGLLRTPEENLHRVIGETIRGLRKDRSLTLKQMARRTGLSVSLLSQIERAESSASISSLYKIATALDVRIQDLFGEY